MKQEKRKQKEELSLIIQKENEMLNRVMKIIKTETIVLAVFIILLVWGATNLTDPLLPTVSDGMKRGFYWIGLIGTIVFGILMVLSFMSYRNGKKSVLQKIREYESIK